MSEQIQANNNELSFITSPKAICDGPKIGRHPRVFLTVKGGIENEVVCPYCSHTFRFKPEEAEAPTPKKEKAAPKRKAAKRKAS